MADVPEVTVSVTQKGWYFYVTECCRSSQLLSDSLRSATTQKWQNLHIVTVSPLPGNRWFYQHRTANKQSLVGLESTKRMKWTSCFSLLTPTRCRSRAEYLKKNSSLTFCTFYRGKFYTVSKSFFFSIEL